MLAIRLPPVLLDRANRAAYWKEMTLTDLIEQAIEASLAGLEKKEGGEFRPIPPA